LVKNCGGSSKGRKEVGVIRGTVLAREGKNRSGGRDLKEETSVFGQHVYFWGGC